ncbi:MAG: glycosyltransferase [Treponema sp.]|jgi:hypothetical protein|nr:glycosyltransferase [Treponema sp.]
MITVLACYERISLFHTLEPFFRKRFRARFRFTQSPRWCLEKDRNRVLVMERWFQARTPPDLALMERLRNKYDRIYFLSGQPDAGTHGLELLPYVDRLFHKSVFRDRELYNKNLYSKNLFADYYHRNYGVNDTRPEYHLKHTLSKDDQNKLCLSWNIGVGDYPRRHTRQRVGVLAARAGFPRLGRCFKTGNENAPADFSGPRRGIAVHARIDPVTSESVAYQRVLFLKTIQNDPLFLTGLVNQNQYYRELRNAKMALSPFGWGEVCFRDFEAIRAGALLLKPDMSHLDTWPDVYVPYETYIPLNWDASDLKEKAAHYLSCDAERARIARSAWEQYSAQLAQVEDRFAELFAPILHKGTS